MKWITRSAAKRLAVALVVLVGLTIWAWFAMIRMPLQSYQGSWAPLSPEEDTLRESLQRDVTRLATEIGERNVFSYEPLRQSADFIEASFTGAGFAVRRQSFEVNGRRCDNLEAELRGQTRPEEIVVIGAHYDSVGGCPGANDNGSGTAALLALARMSSRERPARTVRFVAFVNEEPPFFQTANMGSLVYARACQERGDRIAAMLSLETIGYYVEEAGSQKYPFPVGLFYPSRGNFIAFVGRTNDRALVRQCVASFRRHSQFPSEGGALPALLPGVGWSDHWAFWQAGYPAIMVTDTAPFRYPHYHTPEDTPDQLHYDRMARVVAGLREVIAELTNPQSNHAE